MKMKKKVDITPTLPIFQLRVPVVGPVMNYEMAIGDIGVCIYARALVDEILEDGTKVRLNLQNYDKDNSHLAKSNIEKIVDSVKGVENIEEVIVDKNTKLEPSEILKEEVVPVPEVEEPQVESEEVVPEIAEEPQVQEYNKGKKKDRKK